MALKDGHRSSRVANLDVLDVSCRESNVQVGDESAHMLPARSRSSTVKRRAAIAMSVSSSWQKVAKRDSPNKRAVSLSVVDVPTELGARVLFVARSWTRSRSPPRRTTGSPSCPFMTSSRRAGCSRLARPRIARARPVTYVRHDEQKNLAELAVRHDRPILEPKSALAGGPPLGQLIDRHVERQGVFTTASQASLNHDAMFGSVGTK